ncbi:ATP-binding domain-containing protein [Paenibacillus sp. YYML68]|uniref:HelD family protein n=1 Tax=Paenibacillus sp. YYML68 TaxID=2909250 RepID=UPI00248FE5E0|nr:ATP-binding domain-containing protein [Paenibacillus sp. YYML68]
MDTALEQAYQQELDYLNRTIQDMDEQLARLEATPRYTGHDVSEQVLESIRENKRHALTHAKSEPYFGRLDFQESGKTSPTPLYIGKFGVEKAESPDLLVIDWRAPVASLFYSFTGGTEATSYESPEGTIEGLVYLKRNLVIRKQLLQRVVDTFDRSQADGAVTDEFLLYRLGENKDNKLRDIVSTIQAEQDAIIRSAKNDALVIQGVAGSGKTTVALHRLAFLLYQYRGQVNAERMIIFAPNRMFLDYISGVLPELGVGHIQQTTFADWALGLLEDEIELSAAADRLELWFRTGKTRPMADDSAPGRMKGSLAFMELLQAVLDEYERQAVPKKDYSPWPGKKLPAAVIQQWYDVEYKHEPVMKRRERILARIKRWSELELEKVWEVHLRKEYKKKVSASLREYGKLWTPYTPFTFYKELLLPDDKLPDFVQTAVHKHDGELLSESVRADSLKLAKKKKVQPEDLAPMLLIHHRFYSIHSDDRFDHTVIDEAQDFSPFQVALLQLHTKNGSFTILGDLSQGIHAYQGVHRWEELLHLFPEDERGFFTLNRSYRSTMEIIEFANGVLERAPEPPPALAVPVFRSGREVAVHEVAEHELLERLIAHIRTFRERGGEGTFAVLTRTEERSSMLHEALAAAGCPDVHRISAGQQHYEGGVSVLPVYLSKGLEFDAVLIVDADAASYERTMWDARLLYVGCTRALHELELWYEGARSELIS